MSVSLLEAKLELEVAEINVKLVKLSNFFKSDSFKSLEEYPRELLEDQYTAMSTYKSILEKRIDLL